MTYQDFLETKLLKNPLTGFKPLDIPDHLFDFQKTLLEWSLKKGCAAILADCGLGKTPIQLSFADNVVRKTNKNVLILAPLAVSAQTIREAEKFGVEAKRTKNGEVHKGINVTNYERLAKYNPKDFQALVLDESSIIKNSDGKTRKAITEFTREIPYRLLCTATPAPNDYMELGCSSEALGVMTRNQMLGMFFTKMGQETTWDLKGHARKRFWQWMAGWARAVRKPSDLGFDDGKFILPPLNIKRHLVASENRKGFFPELAKTLHDQRNERRKTIKSRCEKVCELVPRKRPCVVWCHLNDEGDLLEELIPNAVQVSGSDSDDVKEERLIAFSTGEIQTLVTKPRIASFGLNWQHCADVVYFPSYSAEQFYQAIRRCYRFGQKNEVNCHIVSSEAEALVVDSMIRKEKLSAQMYDEIIRNMNEVLHPKNINGTKIEMRLPKWLLR